jgi:hypothetical protein
MQKFHKCHQTITVNDAIIPIARCIDTLVVTLNGVTGQANYFSQSNK